MNLDALSKSLGSGVLGKAAEMGAQKAKETMDQTNKLLQLLQDAGYIIGDLEMELAVPPTANITLKAGQRVSDSKLEALCQANKDNDVLSLVLSGLIQANKLSDSVKLATIELKEVKISLKTPPSITLHWKDRAPAATNAAAS